MSIDKFKSAENALKQFEKLYGYVVRKVFSIANGYISRELTDGMIAGVPQRAVLDSKTIWVVPIVLTRKAGGYGEIGAIIIDDQTYSILGSTDKTEVFQKAEALFHDKVKAIYYI